VIDGWVCLAGVRETDHLVPLGEHPNRQAIARTVRGATHVAGPAAHARRGRDRAGRAVGRAAAFDASPQGSRSASGRPYGRRRQQGVE
jgi:hypothetical protein